jgi:bifunctional non-homologous end joining protein LigD
MDPLQRYREMRDFRVTPEPQGRQKRKEKQLELRYYIQRHHATRLHYDFRLELEGTLKSWAVPKGPSLDPSVKRLAMQTEDHPLEYGEFEGTIPEKQYGAGDVLLWDQGTWIPEDDDPAAALRKGRLHFELRGEKLRGRWILARTRSSEGSGQERPAWLLMKRNDDEARPGEGDIVLERPESVKQPPKAEKRARRIARAHKETWIPEFVAPMLATLVTEPPRSGDWVYEVKHDGYRMLCRISKEGIRLFTRTGREWTAKLPHLVAALRELGIEDSLLDGEIVVPGPDGRSDFQALQNAFDAHTDSPVVYYVFDAPYLDGHDLRRLPLKERKARLEKKLRPSSAVRFSDDLPGDAQQVLEEACKLGLEGLIGKEAGSVYVSGRSKSWIKLKCRQRQDFVIGGFTAPGGSRQGFGAILVGYYDAQGKLVYAGKVGTGFDEALLSSLHKRMSGLRRADSPFAEPPAEKKVTWLQPKLVCEVAYTERTKEGILRQASFMGLREDIAAKSVGEEKAVPPTSLDGSSKKNPSHTRPSGSDEVRGVKISNPGRVVWPEPKITKLALARFYDEIGEWLLPHVKDRPLSLVRCPDGIGSECFYQRHLLMARSPGHLKTVRRLKSSKSAYIYADSMDAVISAVQNNAIEFHTWGATVPDIQHPDRITIDLDPGPGVSWAQLAGAARLTRTLLDGLGLESFLKTTGGKGLHVVAPVRPGLGWDEVKEFTRLIAVMLRKAQPELFIEKMAKDRRDGKIFVDYLRNSETASAVAAFSARARPGAMVSTPLAWDELGRADLRDKFTIKTVPARLATLGDDPWRDYWRSKQSITPKMIKALGG